MTADITCAPERPAIIARAQTPRRDMPRPVLRVQPQPKPAARRSRVRETACSLPPVPPQRPALQGLPLADVLPAGGGSLPALAALPADTTPLVLDPPRAGPVRFTQPPAVVWALPPPLPAPWVLPAPMPVVSEPPTWQLLLAAIAAWFAWRFVQRVKPKGNR